MCRGPKGIPYPIEQIHGMIERQIAGLGGRTDFMEAKHVRGRQQQVI
jgi:hypothetical protein